MTIADLYCPLDVAEAYDAWKATCGPVAVAAVLRRPVESVRELFPDFQGWVNFTGVANALNRAGASWHATKKTLGQAAAPEYGLALIQWCGPWLDPGVPIGAAYRHTHWVGLARVGDGRMVYDINADGWIARDLWLAKWKPQLVAAQRGATGGFWLRFGIEVLHVPEEKTHGMPRL